MKKKNLKVLKLNKEAISEINSIKVSGGNDTTYLTCNPAPCRLIKYSIFISCECAR